MKIKISSTPEGSNKEHALKEGSIAKRVEANTLIERRLEDNGMFIFEGEHEIIEGQLLRQSLSPNEYEVIED